VTDDFTTQDAWHALNKTRWVDEARTVKGSQTRKTYVLYWEGALLHVLIGNSQRFALPSIDGGLRWGVGGKTNSAPKFTLAFEDADDDRLTWRNQDGTVANV